MKGIMCVLKHTLFIWHSREPPIEGTEEALSGEWS